MKKILILTTVAILISGCGGGAPNKAQSDLDKNPTPPPETTPPPADENRAPTIAGTPTSSLLANTDYLFTPVAADADNDVLTFSIINKPSWAEFDTSTGELKGQASTAASFENIIISVADKVDTVNLDKFSILVIENNLPPVIYNQTLETMESTELMITLGPKNDIDGDYINYSVTDSMNTEQGNQTNQIIYNSASIGVETLQVTASDNKNEGVTATINITTSPSSPSNYITSREIIRPVYGDTVPVKGEFRIDPISGTKITRLTDANELDGTDDALIVYSRYTPENTSGEYFLAFGSNSTTSWLIDRETGDVVTKLSNINNKDIGESNEVRWDISGNKPNRLYYRYAMSFYKVDVIKTKNEDTGENAYALEHALLKDFSSLVPAAQKLYNDVEGDSSNDSDHWAFMAAHYDGVTYVVDAFIHYQISTGETHTMTAQDLAGSPLNHYAEANKMPRPNMVEINPTGTGIVLHFGRSWETSTQSVRPEDIGTFFDGAHLWPLDFNYSAKEPVKISISETHAGWSFDDEGREMFISQNNRKDDLDAIYTSGDNSGYDHRVIVAKHDDFGWSTGFHYGKMPLSKKGWTFINTYSNVSRPTHDTDWAVDQLIMMKIDSITNNPKIWRISPNYNRYAGHYRDEAPAAINTQGNRIYVTTNWGGNLPNREVFLFELPSNWDSVLNQP